MFSVFTFFETLCFAVAVTEGLVREEQLLHDLCLLGATTVEITQMLTRAELKITSEPLLRLEPGLVVWQSHRLEICTILQHTCSNCKIYMNKNFLRQTANKECMKQ